MTAAALVHFAASALTPYRTPLLVVFMLLLLPPAALLPGLLLLPLPLYAVRSPCLPLPCSPPLPPRWCSRSLSLLLLYDSGAICDKCTLLPFFFSLLPPDPEG